MHSTIKSQHLQGRPRRFCRLVSFLHGSTLPFELCAFVSKRGLNKRDFKLRVWRRAATIFLSFITVDIRSLGVRRVRLSRTTFKTSGFAQLNVCTKGISQLSLPSDSSHKSEFKIAQRSSSDARLMPESIKPLGYFLAKRYPLSSSQRSLLLFGSDTMIQMRRAREYGMFINVFRG